jgi:hypothetical protein
MRQSSIMRHSVSTGPSRKACSSEESVAGGVSCRARQSGLPADAARFERLPLGFGQTRQHGFETMEQGSDEPAAAPGGNDDQGNQRGQR